MRKDTRLAGLQAEIKRLHHRTVYWHGMEFADGCEVCGPLSGWPCKTIRILIRAERKRKPKKGAAR